VNASLAGVVAIVDDDHDIAQALKDWFQLGGLQAENYKSGESLLLAIAQSEGYPTLQSCADPSVHTELVGVVLDLNLPCISGFELAAALRLRFPRLPLVVITAMRDFERAPHRSACADITCLQKPFDLDDLDDALFPMMYGNLRQPQDRSA
jgi:FixJ family two-component response regulator